MVFFDWFWKCWGGEKNDTTADVSTTELNGSVQVAQEVRPVMANEETQSVEVEHVETNVASSPNSSSTSPERTKQSLSPIGDADTTPAKVTVCQTPCEQRQIVDTETPMENYATPETLVTPENDNHGLAPQSDRKHSPKGEKIIIENTPVARNLNNRMNETPYDPFRRHYHKDDEPIAVVERSFSARIESAMKREARATRKGKTNAHVTKLNFDDSDRPVMISEDTTVL